MFRRTVVVSVLVMALCAPEFAFGWGDDGHMAINRAAATHLPPSMPEFFRKSVDYLAYLGPEPDRWRNKAEASLKYSQEPDHFIDLERTEGIGELPVARFDYIQKLYALRTASKKDSDLLLPDKVGFQPYVVAEIYGRLKVALREYRRLKAAGQPTAPAENNALFYAGWLGHYVADGSNPMHTTIHYNGWVGDNPKGYSTANTIHWTFEGVFVHNNLAQLQFADMVKVPSAPLADPWKDYQSYLRTSFGLVEKLYGLEKTGAFNNAGTPEGIAFTKARLAAGADMLAKMWYTAWVESEKPVESPF